MNKWNNAAKKRRAAIDAANVKAEDLDVIVSALKELHQVQLKKVLSEDVLAALEKYGVVIS